ncbi:class I SAM-dependent methyltransferase [candidate division KSB1 bacterium]|nr:class I SAM-dependent methyltransferase [candidate division KSB1 bacterium]
MDNPRCRSCNAEEEYQVIRAHHVFGSDGNHRFWECEKCGLIYLWPVPTVEQERIFYSQEFEKFMEKRSGGDRDWSGPEAHIMTNNDHVERRLKIMKDDLLPGKDILEIGCSSGFMLDAFKELGMNPIGIEPSGSFSNFLSNRSHISYSSIEELHKEKQEMKFDLIVHFFVLEHIRDTKGFIQEQLSMLKPEGMIISEVPCVMDPLITLYKISAFDQFYWSIAHHYYFSEKSLSYILDQLDCVYEYVPEQRYDLSNHMVWMLEGKPGGQGKYDNVFSKDTLRFYKRDLIKNNTFDTFFVFIKKKDNTN